MSKSPAAVLWAAVLAGYGLLTCALTWPLPIRLHSHLPGDPGGDTGVYVWNLWIFRHELLRHAHLPFSTDHVFSYTGGADFSLHNYAPIAGALGAPLIAPLGVVGAFNVLMLLFITLSGIGVFILARRLGLGPIASWLAGALFMASPVLVARETAHFSLVIAATLPLFLWGLLRTLDSGRTRDAVIVGVIVAAAYYSDSYYGIYCAMMGAFVVTWRYCRVVWPDAAVRSRSLERSLNVLIAFAAGVIAWRVFSGAQRLVIGPIQIGIGTLYTPQLVLLLAVAFRVWLIRRPVVRAGIAEPQWRALVRLGAVSVGVCVTLLLPPLLLLARRFLEGRMPDTAIYWRSSPRGVDVLSYFIPNPNHAWFGAATRSWFMPPQADAFPELVGSFSIVALTLIALAAYLRLLPKLWLAFTGFFMLLSLGPFIHIAGLNTQMAAPWAFLRYLPVIGMARSPSRFAIVAALGLSLLVAFSIEALWRRYRAPRWATALVVVLLGMELLPAPRPLFSAAVPDVYRMVAVNGDEAGRLLDLPTGIRDGTSSLGDFNASSEYFQTTHRRPLVGGYLSRVSQWRKETNERVPMLRALFALSEGRALSPDWMDAARHSREAFLKRSCVRFVVINKSRSTSELRVFAEDALRLRLIHEDATHALFAPADPPACEPRPMRTVSAAVGASP